MNPGAKPGATPRGTFPPVLGKNHGFPVSEFFSLWRKQRATALPTARIHRFSSQTPTGDADLASEGSEVVRTTHTRPLIHVDGQHKSGATYIFHR